MLFVRHLIVLLPIASRRSLTLYFDKPLEDKQFLQRHNLLGTEYRLLTLADDDMCYIGLISTGHILNLPQLTDRLPQEHLMKILKYWQILTLYEFQASFDSRMKQFTPNLHCVNFSKQMILN